MKDRLKELTESILHSEHSPGELLSLCRSLQSLFEEASEIDFEDKESKENIKLESGTAIGSTWAAMCIQDFVRTERFLKAIYQAINDKLQINPDIPVQILYAGCGPFATLIAPLMTIFNKDQIQCTLIEINPLSIKALNKTITALDAESFIHEIKNCDAAKYVIDQNYVPDIVICETLQAALRKEPQVAIYLHLGPQVNENTVFIPESIDIHCGLLNSSLDYKRMMEELAEGESSFLILEPLLELNKSTYRIPSNSEENLKQRLFSAALQLPDDLNGYDRICFFTKIKLYKNIGLDYWESPLTIPIQFSSLGPQHTGKHVSVYYELSADPEFKMEFL